MTFQDSLIQYATINKLDMMLLGECMSLKINNEINLVIDLYDDEVYTELYVSGEGTDELIHFKDMSKLITYIEELPFNDEIMDLV